MGNKSGLRIAAAFLLIFTSATSAGAQSNQTENTINALGNLFGALAQAGAKANAKKKWGQVTPEVKQCLNLMLTSKNVSVDQFADAGIAPDDQRVAPAINACNQYLTTPLKTDFPCTVTNSKGEQVTTTCNESYAKEVDGALVPISGEDMLIAAGGGQKVVAGNFETTVAQKARLAQEEWASAEAQRAEAARLAGERREEEAQRAAFLASPEGKRQAATEAVLAKKRAYYSNKAQTTYDCHWWFRFYNMHTFNDPKQSDSLTFRANIFINATIFLAAKIGYSEQDLGSVFHETSETKNYAPGTPGYRDLEHMYEKSDFCNSLLNSQKIDKDMKDAIIYGKYKAHRNYPYFVQ